MTEKKGNEQGAFWDISENTNADLEVIADEPNDAGKEFHPHEPRERTNGVYWDGVIFSLFMAAFVSLFLFSMVEDTWHITPWECSEEVVEAEDGTFECQQYGLTEPREYDSAGFEIVELSEKVIAAAMYMLIIFLLIVYCWGKLSRKDHLRHLGEENVIVLMTSRFGKTPKIKEMVHLQDDSFILRTSGQYRNEDGKTDNYVGYRIYSKGQKPFKLSKFEESDYAYVTGLEIRR